MSIFYEPACSGGSARTRKKDSRVSSDVERGCVGMCVCVSPTCHWMGGTAETVQFWKTQRLPPPCAMQSRVRPLPALAQPGLLQRAPPPCRMQNSVGREHPFTQPAYACALTVVGWATMQTSGARFRRPHGPASGGVRAERA